MKRQYRLLKIIYSHKTNPEVMYFQALVRNYSGDIKKNKIKLRYVKNIKVPFIMQLFDKQNRLVYQTNDYRRLKYTIRRIEFVKDD